MSKKQLLIERPPRIQPDLPKNQIEIPPPPSDKQQQNQRPMLFMFLPFIMILGYLAMAMMGGGGSSRRRLMFMVPMALSTIASVVFAFQQRSKGQENQGKAEAAYADRLVEMREDMQKSHDTQRRFYRHNYPTLSDRYYIVRHAYVRADNPSSIETDSLANKLAMRLWERRSSDTDFCEVRIGMGTRPSTVVYTSPSGGSFDSPHMRDAMRLAADSQHVDDVPITIKLRPTGAEREKGGGSARYSIGITGNNQDSIYAFIHAFVWNYVTFHSPQDANVIVLGADEAEKKWHWVTGLPHFGGMCLESDEDRTGDPEDSMLLAFTKNLRKSYEERERRLADPEFKGDISLPFQLIIVDMLNAPEQSQVKNLDTDAAVSLMMRSGAQVGGAVIFLVSTGNEVPTHCQSVVELTQPVPTESGVHRPMQFRYAEVGVNTLRYTGVADRIYKQEALHDFASFLNPLNVPQTSGGGIPRAVLMFNMLRIEDADDLRSKLYKNWQRSMLPPQKRTEKGKKISYEKDYSGWLRNTLGATSDGSFRTLRYSADGDGVHGLIAGSTGSGKSELLMTMILDLAYRYDPSIINFVLVDFKGGGAFKPFFNNRMKLPHVVDVVTNLGPSAVERMFAAITAELDRRQAINTETDSKHLVDYRKNSLHLPDPETNLFGNKREVRGRQIETAPYPHLFVIIDEFAEMIASNPEYKAQLNSITRLGRALGVTLILAAQRPTGVTDQMRANIKFRIALRVETREESGEILRQPDAAYLPTGTPGRGYLQVGNENIELVQIAWSGNDYKGKQLTVVDDDRPVLWPDRQHVVDDSNDDEEAPKIFEVMIQTMEEVSADISLTQRKPWPDFLPEYMSLQHEVDLYRDYWTGEGIYRLLPPDDLIPGVDKDVNQTHAPIGWAVDHWMKAQDGWYGVDWSENGNAMRPIVGLIDDPYNAKQHPLLIDFRQGHGVVFSSSGWGKTTFLRTLMATLAATHSPNELHIYILDFGGQQLMSLRRLPHVGSIIIPDEEEKVRRSLSEIDRILEERKKTFSKADVNGLYAFNEKYPDQAMPAILFAIDNFAAFREGFEELIPSLTSLVRESRAAGIHFAVSAEQPSLLSGKLYSLFSERVALKLSDATEYTAIVGRGAREIEDIAGRGYVKLNRRAAMCQVALPVGENSANLVTDELTNLSILMRIMETWMENNPDKLDRSQFAPPIEVLTMHEPLNALFEKVKNQKEQKKRGIHPVLGIEGATLTPWAMDIARQGPHCEIIGPSGSGKTTVLRTLALSLATHYKPSDVVIVLVDVRRRLFEYKGNHTLDELPHVVEAVSEEEQLTELPDKLQAEVDNPQRGDQAIVVIIDNYDSFNEDAEAIRPPDRKTKKIIDRLSKLARERGQDGLHFIIAGSLRMPNDQLRKQIKSCRFGIGMKVSDSAIGLDGKVPRHLQRTELPMGRGFMVKSSRTTMVQIGTPYQDDDNIESDLDDWVIRLSRADVKKNEWVYTPPEPPSEEEEDGETNSETKTEQKTERRERKERKPRASSRKKKPKKQSALELHIASLVGKVNLDELREKISAKTFLPVSFYANHSAEQLIKDSIRRDILEGPKEK